LHIFEAAKLMSARAQTDNVKMRAIASLPRPNARIVRQCRYCLIVHDGTATMRQPREYCYFGEERQHFHYRSIWRALMKLGAKRIGWGIYALRLS
jgi:hypothetical protein